MDSRNGKTPVTAGVCHCAEPCQICKCKTTKKTAKNQLVSDYKARIRAALKRFMGGGEQ